jgi:prolyl oligopeptidase
MLRYHKFTIGFKWSSEYGRSDVHGGFDFLIKYSPYHNIRKQKYPAMLVTSGDHDDRVVPLHTYKFVASL